MPTLAYLFVVDVITAEMKVVHVGTLLDLPGCYQTDAGEGYSSTWNAVVLDKLN